MNEIKRIIYPVLSIQLLFDEGSYLAKDKFCYSMHAYCILINKVSNFD